MKSKSYSSLQKNIKRILEEIKTDFPYYEISKLTINDKNKAMKTEIVGIKTIASLGLCPPKSIAKRP